MLAVQYFGGESMRVSKFLAPMAALTLCSAPALAQEEDGPLSQSTLLLLGAASAGFAAFVAALSGGEEDEEPVSP